jgi:hypothetical protein
MKANDNGSFFTVSYSKTDCDDFSRTWPCSTVRGRGAFVFDKRNGDLVDVEGSALKGDGPDWLAFSHDCQVYGQARLIPGSTINDAMKAVYASRHGQEAV